MVKRTLIAIIVVALLASATRASIPVPICNVPVYMYVDGEVEKFYFDCEKFEVKANFNAKLSLSIDVIDPEFTDWDFYFDGGDTVPGDGYWHTLKACVWTYKPKQLLGNPGEQVKIGTVTIGAMPLTVDEAMSVGYYIQVKNVYDHKFVLRQYVDIDIKPGSYPNSINPNAGGVIPVAILTTADFDASTVDPQMVALEGAGARAKGKSGRYGSMEDVDGDGDLDLVVQIENVIEWDPEATEATLTGETYNGIYIQGMDTVNIVPPE